MPKFIVEVREIWTQQVEVEAENWDKAIAKVEEGEGEYVEDGFEYSHTLESDHWTSYEKE